MYEDVVLLLPACKGTVEVILEKPNRQSFRDRLLALGGEMDRPTIIVGIPEDKLEEIERIIGEEYPKWRTKRRDERPKQQREGDQVFWCDERGAWSRSRHRHGYVGKVHIFSVEHPHNAPDKEYPYGLTTTLPGFGKYLAWGKTEAAAEKRAEGVLVDFLASLGAELKDDNADSRAVARLKAEHVPEEPPEGEVWMGKGRAPCAGCAVGDPFLDPAWEDCPVLATIDKKES